MMDNTIPAIKINKDVDSFLKIISEAKCNCTYITKGTYEHDFYEKIKQCYIPLYNDTSGKLIYSATSTLDIEPIRNFIINAGLGKPSVLFINENSIEDTLNKFNSYVKFKGEDIDPRVLRSIIGNSIDFYCSLEKNEQTDEYMICISQLYYDIKLEKVMVKDIYKGDAPLIEPLRESKVNKLIRRGIDLERIRPWVSEYTIKEIQ